MWCLRFEPWTLRTAQLEIQSLAENNATCHLQKKTGNIQIYVTLWSLQVTIVAKEMQQYLPFSLFMNYMFQSTVFFRSGP